MGIILRTQKMADGHAAAAFHKHCNQITLRMVRAPIEPIIVFLGAARQVTADRWTPGIHVQQAPLHNPAQITLVSSVGNAKIIRCGF
jgi:hypothetical protein